MERITQEQVLELIQSKRMEFHPTQKRLCLPVINRIFRKMRLGIKFAGIKVERNLICDGHHRYVASLGANFPLEIIPGTASGATLKMNWEEVIFEEDDWDTPAKIEMLNRQDADYNDLSLSRLLTLLQ